MASFRPLFPSAISAVHAPAEGAAYACTLPIFIMIPCRGSEQCATMFLDAACKGVSDPCRGERLLRRAQGG